MWLVVIKLADLEKYEYCELMDDLARFNTMQGWRIYKMCLCIFPKGHHGYNNYVSVYACWFDEG